MQSVDGRPFMVIVKKDNHMFSDTGGNRGKGGGSGSSKGSPNTSHVDSKENSKGTVSKESSTTSNVTSTNLKDASKPATPSPPDYEKVMYGEHFTKKGRKKVLKPNVEYTSPDGYTYRTDSQGRIIECEGTIVLGKGDRSEYAQRTVGKGQGRLPDDDGGHLIGAQFKGPKDIDNLVPQNSQINRSDGVWYEMETDLVNALKEVPPKKVTVKIEPIYSGKSMRPDAFEVVYEIEGKGIFEKIIKNQSGG